MQLRRHDHPEGDWGNHGICNGRINSERIAQKRVRIEGTNETNKEETTSNTPENHTWIQSILRLLAHLFRHPILWILPQSIFLEVWGPSSTSCRKIKKERDYNSWATDSTIRCFPGIFGNKFPWWSWWPIDRPVHPPRWFPFWKIMPDRFKS